MRCGILPRRCYGLLEMSGAWRCPISVLGLRQLATNRELVLTQSGLGLRPKASPPVRHGTPLLHAESAGQSQIGRCLTLQRDAHRQQILAPESSGSGCPVEDIANRRSSTPPRHDLPSPPSRPTFAYKWRQDTVWLGCPSRNDEVWSTVLHVWCPM